MSNARIITNDPESEPWNPGWKLPAAIAAVHTVLIALVLALEQWTPTQGVTHKWLESIAGTLSFPITPYTDLDFSTDSPAPLAFRWWSGQPSKIPLLGWILSIAFWSATLNWAIRSAARRGKVALPIVLVTGGVLGFNFLCYCLLVSIELSSQWRDFISIFGTLATLLAFFIAIKQISDAKHATEIAIEASISTANEYEEHYFRYSLSEAKRYYSLVRQRLNQATATTRGNSVHWQMASEYLMVMRSLLADSPRLCAEEHSASFQELDNLMQSVADDCLLMVRTNTPPFDRGPLNDLDRLFTSLCLAYLTAIPRVQ